MKIDLTDKNALVGASTQGIGLAIATQLAYCGASVTMMARDEETLKQLVAKLPITQAKQQHAYLRVDFSDYTSFNETITNFFRRSYYRYFGEQYQWSCSR